MRNVLQEKLKNIWRKIEKVSVSDLTRLYHVSGNLVSNSTEVLDLIVSTLLLQS